MSGFDAENKYPINSNKYYVVFGSFSTSFSKVSGITLKSSQLIPLNEGGNNKPYIIHDVKKEFNTITFEKGYGTIDIMEIINKIDSMTIIIKGNDKAAKYTYHTDMAVVQNVVLSDLNANESKILIQSMTIAYNTLKKTEQATDINDFSGYAYADTFKNNMRKETASILNKNKSYNNLDNIMPFQKSNGFKNSFVLEAVKQNEYATKKIEQEKKEINTKEKFIFEGLKSKINFN